MNIPHPGRLVMVNIEGTTLNPATAAFLSQHHIRAVCLFRPNLGSEQETRKLISDLREVMGPDALIAIDQEGGSVIRATFLPQAPAAMALGAIGDEALAEQVGAAVARGLRSVGVNWNFAPVLDVNNNPANPVIGERSFGEDPECVARLAAAWLRGSLREGVACCVKHFPGHGDTHVDSHHALPSVDKSEAALEALELRPFRALVGEAPAVMTAHIVYPQIDPEYPATLSRRILTGILRQSIGYDGVVITDALMMKAIYERYGHARAAVMALQAGADMPLAQGSQAEQAAAIAAIGAALADGRLDAEALAASNARLDALARHYPVNPGNYHPRQRETDEALMFDAWARSLTALGGAQPPARHRPLRVITQRSVVCDGVSEAGLDAEEVMKLFSAFEDVVCLPLDDLSRLEKDDVPRDGRCNVLVSNHRSRFRESARHARPDLHLALWNPYQVMDVAAPAVVTWGYSEGALAALKAWLEGRLTATARPPVQLEISTGA